MSRFWMIFILTNFIGSLAFAAGLKLKPFSKELCKESETVSPKDLELPWLSIKTEDNKTTVNVKCTNGRNLVFGKDLAPGADDLPSREYVEKIICDMRILVQGFDANSHGRQFFNLDNCDSMLDGFANDYFISSDRKLILLKNDSYTAESGEYASANLKIFDCSGSYCESLIEEVREEVKYTNVKWTSKTTLSLNIETLPNPDGDPSLIAEKKKIKALKCVFDFKSKSKSLSCK